METYFYILYYLHLVATTFIHISIFFDISNCGFRCFFLSMLKLYLAYQLLGQYIILYFVIPPLNNREVLHLSVKTTWFALGSHLIDKMLLYLVLWLFLFFFHMLFAIFIFDGFLSFSPCELESRKWFFIILPLTFSTCYMKVMVIMVVSSFPIVEWKVLFYDLVQTFILLNKKEWWTWVQTTSPWTSSYIDHLQNLLLC